jgi:hypothetical protein
LPSTTCKQMMLSAAPKEGVAAETNPLPVIGSLAPQRVLDTPC